MGATEVNFLLISAGFVGFVATLGIVGYCVAGWLDRKYYPDDN